MSDPTSTTISAPTLSLLCEALQIGRGYVAASLAQRQAAMAEHTVRWVGVENDLAKIDLGLVVISELTTKG